MGLAISKNIPTVIIVFGATGDLMAKKIAPSLYSLYSKNKLPKLFKVIGFARRDYSDEDFRNHVLKSLKAHKGVKGSKAKLDSFLKMFFYEQGLFQTKKDYTALAKTLGYVDDEWKVCSNKLFYLSVPPSFYEVIFKNLHSTGLTAPCSEKEGWTRVIVEKPFGNNLKTAKKLDQLLRKLFRDEQVYAVDHYLAKEMLQNILIFRFTNNLFRDNWSNKLIERIEIQLHETIGVEQRGGFYDGVGALMDVGQNHLLQMLALVTMDHPTSFSANDVRPKRAEILKTLKIPTKEEIKNHTYRAQYDGYRKIKGVKPNSNTETYFKIVGFLDSPLWRGVPVIMESGKLVKDQVKGITIVFKHPVPCLCPPGAHVQNKIVFSLEPEEGINIQFWSKKPGLKMEMGKRQLNFLYRGKKQRAQYIEEYEKLLLDCIEGNQILFVSIDEVQAMWKFIDPIIEAWRKNIVPLKTYKPGTNQPLMDSMFVNETAKPASKIKKKIGLIGLGKMGGGIARQLMEKGWDVVGYNRTAEVTKGMEMEGLTGAYSHQELIKKLPKPRVVWLMIPAGKPVDDTLFGKDGLVKLMDKGDIIVDGGNSYFKNTVKRAKKVTSKGIHYVDAGVSGGPKGARYGACIMVGGEKKDHDYLSPLFTDIVQPGGVEFFPGHGAGHFVKMVHNGIEYGMMQAIGEGFNIMKKSKYRLDLSRVAEVYRHGSVIESRLVDWLKNAFDLSGTNLTGVSGSVSHTGEGEWTVKTAKEMRLQAKIIEGALKFRIMSEKNPDYTGKVVSALREQFGGHSVRKK